MRCGSGCGAGCDAWSERASLPRKQRVVGWRGSVVTRDLVAIVALYRRNWLIAALGDIRGTRKGNRSDRMDRLRGRYNLAWVLSASNTGYMAVCY